MNPCVAREYIESCLKIRTKSGAVVPFRLNAAQQKLYAVAKRQQDEGKPVRIIILKARQLGFSTLTEALLFHACATRANVNALVVAHREDATANLFRMSKLFYDELPAPLKPMLRTSNAQELVFENPSRASRGALPGLRSRFRCATAGGRGIGRSDHAPVCASFGIRLLAGGRREQGRDARGHIAGRAEPAGDDGHH